MRMAEDSPSVRLSDGTTILRHAYRDELTLKHIYLCDRCDKTIGWWENYNED
jgi:hypothetical protein